MACVADDKLHSRHKIDGQIASTFPPTSIDKLLQHINLLFTTIGAIVIVSILDAVFPRIAAILANNDITSIINYKPNSPWHNAQ